MSRELSTITGKRQLTVPKAVVEVLGLERGDKLAFAVEGSRIIATSLRAPVERAAGSVSVTRARKGGR